MEDKEMDLTAEVIDMVKKARDEKWSDDKIGFEYLKIKGKAQAALFKEIGTLLKDELQK